MPTPQPVRALSLPRALRLSQVADLARALHISVDANMDATPDLMERLRDVDPLDAQVAAAMGAASAAAFTAPRSRFELMLAWIPHEVPITYHFLANGEPVPDGSGVASGGRLFLSIPTAMFRHGTNRIAYTLRFLSSGWKYQIWLRDKDDKVRLVSAEDPDPSSADDDRVIAAKEFQLGGGA